MKTALPIVQSSPAAPANPASNKGGKVIADDFDSALAQQKADNEAKRDAPLQETTEQRHNDKSDTRRANSASQTGAGGRLLHRLREMPHGPVEGSLGTALNVASRGPDLLDPGEAGVVGAARLNDDAAICDACGPDLLSASGDSSPIPPETAGPVTEPALISAATNSFVVLSATSSLGNVGRQKNMGVHTPNFSSNSVDQDQTLSIDLDGDVAEMIAGTPVAVRDQQTHFTRDSARRLSTHTDGAFNRTRVSDNREVAQLRSGVASAHSHMKGANPVQTDPALKGVDAGNLAQEASEYPTPTVQVAGKLIDACAQASSPSETPAQSAAWLSADKPFGSLMRLIRLELTPGSLGVVNITLKGSNATLSISIEAERSQTAASLNADRSTLSSRLREAGYTIDELVVTTLDRPLDTSSPNRSDQTSGSSNSPFANGTDDPQRRHADESGRRSRPDPARLEDGGVHRAADETAKGIPEPQVATPVSWRGRYMTRSV